MKLIGDPEIPIARRSPREPHHSHNFLGVATEKDLKPEILY
jgi:hypothetical protein